MRVDTKQREKVVTDVNNKLGELNIDIIDNGNLGDIENYDAKKKCLKNVSVIISKYPENISIMMILTVS